jgi:hypothetical protein
MAAAQAAHNLCAQLLSPPGLIPLVCRIRCDSSLPGRPASLIRPLPIKRFAYYPVHAKPVNRTLPTFSVFFTPLSLDHLVLHLRTTQYLGFPG